RRWQPGASAAPQGLLGRKCRHPGASRDPAPLLFCSSPLSSSFRRKPEYSVLALSLVSFRSKEQSFHSACGGAGYFLCVCKESNQGKRGREGGRSGPPALQVCERATGFAERTSVCAQRTGAHPARHPYGLFLRPLAAPYGAPVGRHPAAEAGARTKQEQSDAKQSKRSSLSAS